MRNTDDIETSCEVHFTRPTGPKKTTRTPTPAPYHQTFSLLAPQHVLDEAKRAADTYLDASDSAWQTLIRELES